MQLSFHAVLSVCERRRHVIFLAFWWFAGLCLGVASALHISPSLLPMMRTAIASPVSIVGLLTVSLLPLFVSASAAYLDKHVFIPAVAFFKAACFGLLSTGVFRTYHSASWLVHFLFLFSDNFTIPVLCWFWIRHIQKRKAALIKDTLFCSILFVIVGILDFYLISPFLASL